MSDLTGRIKALQDQLDGLNKNEFPYWQLVLLSQIAEALAQTSYCLLRMIPSETEKKGE